MRLAEARGRQAGAERRVEPNALGENEGEWEEGRGRDETKGEHARREGERREDDWR